MIGDDIEKFARQLGQHDPVAGRWMAADNDLGPVKPNWRADLFLALLAFILIGAALLAFFG